MKPAFQLIEVSDDAATMLQPEWLARAETVHRQLRPHLPAAYQEAMREVFADGARMTIAALDTEVVGVAVTRIIVNTAHGRSLYVDDLVTDASKRSLGAGKALLGWCAKRAESLGCVWLQLDSGTQRHAAHRFYLRERMHISSFHFARKLGE